MAQFRLTRSAGADLASILATSLDRWGADASARYAAVITDALHMVAADPQGPNTRTRADLLRGLRSFRLRDARDDHGVRSPVHVIYYRRMRSGMIAIIRVLHERMDPAAHLPRR